MLYTSNIMFKGVTLTLQYITANKQVNKSFPLSSVDQTDCLSRQGKKNCEKNCSNSERNSHIFLSISCKSNKDKIVIYINSEKV